MKKTFNSDVIRFFPIMNIIRSLSVGALIYIWTCTANAAIVAVSDMTITDFDFELQSAPNGGGFLDATAQNKMIAADTNLVGGARSDSLDFDLTVDFIGVNHTEDWTVNVDTTAASPASIDTTTNEFTINLSTFNTDWDGLRCGTSFPTCIDIAQGPVGGTVTGIWNPVTHAFEISWERIMPHPFPDAIGNWTLVGIANPVPVPGSLVLFISGALGLAGMIRRKTMQ